MRYLPLLLCVAALAACSDKPPPAQSKPAAQVATPFDSLRATEQRARDVQKVVDDAAAKQRQQIDAASR